VNSVNAKRHILETILEEMQHCIVACSGGVDSMLLATLAHRVLHEHCRIVHAQSPAVPPEATTRVLAYAREENWRLTLMKTDEFSDEAYLSNPVDRCYYCKDHLYRSLSLIAREAAHPTRGDFSIVSGTNCDDLSEYRPGLAAAEAQGVRHPFVEAGMGKSEIRALSRALALPYAELPASPCLASRLYTGTRVTAERLQAAHFAEEHLKDRIGVEVVRCRLQEDEMRIELLPGDRPRLTHAAMRDLRRALREAHPAVAQVGLDPEAYAPGRAFRKAG